MYRDGVVIEYATVPPNFRDAVSNAIGIKDACGTCSYCRGMREVRPSCGKYHVVFEGFGCLTKTVCNDYRCLLFEGLQ